MGEAVPDRDAGDLQRLEALQRDLQAAMDRAVLHGARPDDVLTCIGLTLGRAVHGMQERPSREFLKLLVIDRLVPAGIRIAQAERAARTAQIYGGEARRRRP